MARSIRQQILDAIVIELERPIWAMASVFAEEPSAIDQGKWQHPACFVYVSSNAPLVGDTPDFAINREFWTAEIMVEVIGPSDIEAYMGKVHEAMMTDDTWGALAFSTERVSASILESDPTREVNTLRFIYRVVYRHADGDPYTAI